MRYPEFQDYEKILHKIREYAALKAEFGADVQPFMTNFYAQLNLELEKLKALPNDRELQNSEPNEYDEILFQCSSTPNILWKSFDEKIYREKLEGALLGRFAGCTLGAPIEFVNLEHVENYMKSIGDAFPPVDYLSQVENPFGDRYMYSKRMHYTRDGMNGVPCDDDITYTILGLLIAEDYGLDFTVPDVGQSWLKYLPMACTAEDVALSNLKKGINPVLVGEIDNPYVQWIGADIRSDPWGYLAPADPFFAAKMAYHDAYISHRRNGIYGEMYFSAVIAAAFATDNARDALEIGLGYIPKNSWAYREIRWALDISNEIKDYKDARIAVAERYKGMSGVHTVNNACFTIWGLLIGGNNFTKVISQTVAMGHDNDCTTATAGSIAGVLLGKSGIPSHWYKNFNNKVKTYINGHHEEKIDDIINRFTIAAKKQ